MGIKKKIRGAKAIANRPKLPGNATSLVQQGARLRDLLELSSIFYWEQDEQHRFRLVQGGDIDLGENDPRRWIGKRRWELGRIPLGNGGGWYAHKALLDARQPFTDFQYKASAKNASARYYSTSGRPVFDDRGRFRGYRGIAQDVTSRIRLQQRLSIEHGVEHVLASVNTIAEVGPKIVQLIGQTLGWACGVRWDEQDGTPCCADTWGDGSPAADRLLDVAFNAADGLISVVGITADAPSPLIRAVSNRFTNAFYFKPDDNGLKGYTGTYVVKAVTEKIGTFDPKAFARAMKNIRLSAKEHPGILMDVAYGDKGDIDRESFVVEVHQGKQQVIATLPPSNAYKARPAAAPAPNVPLPAAANQSPVKFAIVAELSGDGKLVGSSFRDGVSLAVDEINASGGILGRKIDVTVFDTRTDPETAKAVTQKAVDLGAYVIMGPVHSDSTIVSMAISRRVEIPNFVGARATNITQQGNPYIFRTDFSMAASIPRVARLIKDKVRAKTVSILWTDNDLGRSGRTEMLKALEVLKIKVAADVPSDQGQVDFTDAVRKIKQANADAVFVVSTAEESARALLELHKQGIDKPIVGETALVGQLVLDATQRVVPPKVQAQDFVRAAWTKGEAVWIYDIMQDRTFVRAAAAKKAGLRSALALPITDETRVVGVLEFFSREIQEPDAELLKTLKLIASQIGRFLHRQQAQERLRHSEERFRSLTELFSDWYWEQDEELRFVFVSNEAVEKKHPSIGLRLWELPDATPSSGSWTEHKAQVVARQLFRDFEFSRVGEDGRPYYVSLSGAPIHDGHGRFIGYRGVGKDITERKRADERI